MPSPRPLLPLAVAATIFPGILHLGGRLAASSLMQYRRDVEHYLAFCGDDAAQARDPELFRAWRDHMIAHTP